MSLNQRLTGLLFLFLLGAAQVGAQERTATIKGRVVTGTNRFLGQPLTDFGVPLGPAGFSNVAAFNPSGAEPTPLSPGAPPSTRLATYVDPDFLALIGKTPADVDPAKLNVLINDVPVNVSPAGDQRVTLRGILRSGQAQPSLAEPSAHVTLGDWVRAAGTAQIRCRKGANTVRLELKGLLPNRLYTVWGILGGDGLAPLPLGGLPNAFTTDKSGGATFERVLNFCPLQPASGERPLVLIDIVLHSDQQVYGAMPDLPFANLFTGTINHTQYEFQLAGSSLTQ
jgi:hypothetical protein